MTKAIIGIIAVVSVFGVARAEAPALTVWFDPPQSEVSHRLALLCASDRAKVIEQDDNHVLCSRLSIGPSAKAYGVGRGASSLHLMLRFTLVNDQGSTRVQASQWYQNRSMDEELKRFDVTGRTAASWLERRLLTAGGRTSREIGRSIGRP